MHDDPTIDATPASGRWLWIVVVVLTTALIAHTLIGLVLAMAGWYSTWLTVALAAAATAAASRWLISAIPDHRPAGRFAPVVMVVVAIGILGWSMTNMGQHVFTERDPGSYLSTGRWLSDHGDLRPDVSHPVLDEVPGISYAGPAVYEMSPGVVEFQFSHGSAVTMATAYDIAGARALFASSAVVGTLALLAMFLALTTMTSRPWLAVAAATATGISLPVLYTTRASYSEPFVLLLLMVAVAILLADGRRLGRDQLALVGLMVGSATLFRVDAQLYVVGLLALASVLMLRGTTIADVSIMLGASVVPIAIGVIDVRVFARDYAAGLADNIALLDRATAALAVVTLGVGIWVHRRGRAPGLGGGHARIAIGCASAVAIVGVVAWLVRPAVWPASPSWDTDSPFADVVVGLQTQLGLPADPTRSYSELSIESIGWYLGAPLVALAIAGFALIAWRIVAVPSSRLLPAAVIVAIGVPVYLYDTNITPDQLWATRRFVPLVLPSFVLGAVWAADRLLDLFPSTGRARPAVAVALGASLLVPAAVTTWPVREHSEQRGAFASIDALCAELDDDAVVLDLDNGRFSMATRAWCGASVGTISGDAAEAVDAFTVASRAACARRVRRDDSAQPDRRRRHRTGRCVDGGEPTHVGIDAHISADPLRRPDHHLDTRPVVLPETCAN